MSNELESMKYFMAAEKVVNLIFQLDMMLQFIDEYKIEPDESVKQALGPHIDKMKEWIK